MSKLRLSSRLRESCHYAKHQKQNPDFLYIIHSVSPLIIILPLQSMDLPPASSIGRKSHIADRQRWSYPRGRRLKRKKFMKPQSRKLLHCEIAIVGLAFLWSGSAFAQQAESQVMTTTSDTEQAPKLPNDQLDSLVAPIALYPDPLLAQTLAASTYPLEVIQLQQWMDRNKDLKGKALADAVAKQQWDPSIQAMVEFPDVVQRMAGNIQWTTDLGNAFLA